MEKKALVPDTSVIVKWFTKEEDRDKAIKIREKFVNGEIEIAAPDLIIYELSNALRFNPAFNQEDVKEAIQSILDLDFEIITPLQTTTDKAIELAFEYNITIYDAFYVALADELDYAIITADKKLGD